MAFLRTAHVGDVHLEEEHYFDDTAQCLDWFVADAIRSNANLFVINGDLTTYKQAIQERNLWIETLIQMGNQAPVILVAGNHGKNSMEICTFSSERRPATGFTSAPNLSLLNAPALQSLSFRILVRRNSSAVATSTTCRRLSSTSWRNSTGDSTVGLGSSGCSLGTSEWREHESAVGSRWSDDARSIRWNHCVAWRRSISGSVTSIFGNS